MAGNATAIDWLLANGKANGARMVMRVGMSVPSHCALLEDAAKQLAVALAGINIRSPKITVLHNLDAAPRSEPDAIRAALAAQLHQPVQWTRSIQALGEQGINTFFECGPGKVLGGLIKRISAEARLAALEDPVALAAAAELINT